MWIIRGFPKCFHRSEFSDKIFVIERVRTCHLLCKRPGCNHHTSKTQVREAGTLNWLQFMLQWFIRFSEFAEFTEFNESSAPFRENPIEENVRDVLSCCFEPRMSCFREDTCVFLFDERKCIKFNHLNVQGETSKMVRGSVHTAWKRRKTKH